MNRKQIILEWIRIVIGLFIFAFGVHWMLRANIGLAAWDCLGMGMEKQTPLTFGSAMVVTSIFILIIDVLLKERIGFGMIIDALITGNFTQFFLDHSPVPEGSSMLIGIVMMCIGMAFMAVGQFLYMSAGQCCGPRDTLLVALGKRVRSVPIGVVEIVLFAVVLGIGVILGGPVGIGTLVCTFGCGAEMQLVFNLLHFEPRNVVHKDVMTTIRILKNDGKA